MQLKKLWIKVPLAVNNNIKEVLILWIGIKEVSRKLLKKEANKLSG
jgi:hypothetical protein